MGVMRAGALVAAVGAMAALVRGRRPPLPSTGVDEVDRAALADFVGRHGAPDLAPVVIVIAAYDEAEGLPRVLRSLPAEVRGLATDVVVVDDGSRDGTAEAVRGAGGAYVVACPTNRGQGAALRLGYRVARSHGARYIITTDADGQYEPADMPALLAPLLDGSADFVSGSRRLGHQADDHLADDQVRRAGTYVFAWAVSALVGQHLTDTSFGLRAMRAELTAAVTLQQPQYQSSELLIGARMRGFRIVEVPGTMRVRDAGQSKKGANLPYAIRYARVVVGTWWREVRLGPSGRRAAAAQGRAEALLPPALPTAGP